MISSARDGSSGLGAKCDSGHTFLKAILLKILMGMGVLKNFPKWVTSFVNVSYDINTHLGAFITV